MKHANPLPRRASVRRRGASAIALLFWVIALSLFVLPFLRAPDGPTWIGEDTRRAETDIPFDEDIAIVEEEVELSGLGELIAAATEEYFGLESEMFLDSGLVVARRIAPGRELYERECSGCHGESGDGAGPAARFLDPRPRNFRDGVFKFTSTSTGQKPLRTDLFRTITRGLSGASMPDFRLFPEERRWDVVEYVRWIAMRGEFQQLMLDEAYDSGEEPEADELAEILYERWNEENLRGVYPDAPETDRDAESVARGREIFLSTELTQCASCHGEVGRGDGINAQAYDDDWGYKIVPRDFTRGVFRVGEGPEDLWRSIATGINGTPMGSFDTNLTGEQIWDVVHYVQSLTVSGEGSR